MNDRDDFLLDATEFWGNLNLKTRNGVPSERKFENKNEKIK